jgi:hypothetical protein
MKALTLWQPHATLMAIGAKKIETRGWPMPSTLAGAWIALHAAGRLTTPRGWVQSALAQSEEIRRALQAHKIDPATLPEGMIVAVALAKESVPTASLAGRLTADEVAFGDYGTGRHGWMFTEVIPLQRPVMARGAQGIWQLTIHTETEIHADLQGQGRTILGPF